jgi:flagellin-like protein
LNSKKLSRRRFGRAVTPVIGTVLMIGVTLAVGFAAWDWARSAAVSSENTFGNAIVSNMNYLKENYVIVNANFSATATQNVTLWFFNSGNATVYIKQTLISNVSSTSPWTNSTSKLSSTNTAGCGFCLKLPVGQITQIQLKVNTAFKAGVIYTVKAVGQYGNTYTYQQAR